MPNHQITGQPNMLLHIPHASSHIPKDALTHYCVTRAELERQMLLLTDWHTDTLFELAGAARLLAPVNRFVVDVERFSVDSSEPMAKRGMGAVYMCTTDGTALRHPITTREREVLMNAYYWPHHNALDTWATNALSDNQTCLIIDCHSFPSVPLPCDLNQDTDRPDICLGTDEFHTPPALTMALKHHFESAGYRVGIDSPYAGCMVPNACWHQAQNCHSIMIEVNRKLYMDEATGAELPAFEAVKRTVRDALSLAAELQSGSAW